MLKTEPERRNEGSERAAGVVTFRGASLDVAGRDADTCECPEFCLLDHAN